MQVHILEISNGLKITETINGNSVERFVSSFGFPFIRSTNEAGETYQVLDAVGEIYDLPALPSEFVLESITGQVYLPGTGEEIIEYSYHLKPFRNTDFSDKIITIGDITATESTAEIALHESGINAVLVNGTLREKYTKSEFTFAPVTTGEKFVIISAKDDAETFHLTEGDEGTVAVEPSYSGLFIARILLTTETADVELPTPTDTSSLANRDASNIVGADKLAWQDVIDSPIIRVGNTGIGLRGTTFNAPPGLHSIDFSTELYVDRTTVAGDYSFNSGLGNTNIAIATGSIGGDHNNNEAFTSANVGGSYNNNLGMYTASVGGFYNNNSGNGTVSVGGSDNNNLGSYSASIGGSYNNNNNSYQASLGGTKNIGRYECQIIGGSYNLTPTGLTGGDEILFNLGNGTSIPTRSNAIELRKSGLLMIGADAAQITASTNPKTVITKEYFAANIPSGGGTGSQAWADITGKPTTISGYGITDAYTSWNLKTNGVQRTTVQSNGTFDLVAGTNITLSYSAGGVVTINAASGGGGVDAYTKTESDNKYQLTLVSGTNVKTINGTSILGSGDITVSGGGGGGLDTSSLVDKMLSYWDATAGKLVSSGVEWLKSGFLKVTSIVLSPNAGTALPNELGTDGTNVVFGVSKRKLRFGDIGAVFNYTPTGDFTLSAVKTAMETAGYIFNDSVVHITLGANNFVCTIDNGAENIGKDIYLRRTGIGSISFVSSRTMTTTDTITIMNGSEAAYARVFFGTSADLLFIANP